ncbi:MAG: ATP-binding cassette domain-containing protein [Burkholderiaceae bacterium]
MSASRRPAIVQARSLSFAYAGQPALVSDWSATIAAGVTLVHGDTGSGKSTLLRVLAGTLPAVGDLVLAGAPLDADIDAYRRKVFFCDPATDAFDQITARACTASLSGGDTQFSQAEWRTLVEGFALAPHLDKPMFMLSTGSKRKVWLAAALASGRVLVLLDEPTGGLDTGSIRCLRNALSRCAERAERAIVVASHARIDGVPIAGSIELPLRGS